MMTTARVSLLLAAASLLGCAGPNGNAAPPPEDPGSTRAPESEAPPESEPLQGAPDECSLAQSAAGGSSEVGTDPGEAVEAGLDRDVDRGPLVVLDAGERDRPLVVAAAVFDEHGEARGVAIWRVDRESGAVTAANERAASISTSELAPAQGEGADAAARAVALATDCALAAASRSRPAPPEPAPSMRTDLLVLDPATGHSGETVEMRFPEETMRGVAFQLDRRTDHGWRTLYWLTSDGNGGTPSWVPAGTEGHAWEDVGVGGPGPDRIEIPDSAPAGSYRVCTANAKDDFCAPLEVVD